MDTFSSLILFVFTLSLLSFIVLFGRVPALRKTPVGFLHRVLVHSLPNGLYAIDRALFGGHIKLRLKKTSNYLMKENHPLVLVRPSSLISIIIIIVTKNQSANRKITTDILHSPNARRRTRLSPSSMVLNVHPRQNRRQHIHRNTLHPPLPLQSRQSRHHARKPRRGNASVPLR
ncbi:hypothetical protein AAP_02061 [Ascosphaera apis ARSEF 7405]|uniref:Uncharacterized protein n=1 Tax=Ascosphaera apis ARSEF 7405 TaxID=392613 RepID=A0A168AIN6_9EURO|nr:hypothetical protein AAP_02061 [Ascosphaera apis ARSEF 7405]